MPVKKKNAAKRANASDPPAQPQVDAEHTRKAPAPAKTRFQKFEYREVPREQIRQARYNPNVMSDYGRKLLRSKIEDVGCIEALVWNERTGNLVGGHHRLEILDQLEGSSSFLVGVSVVSLSPRREREMNVFLNNSQAQGHFDKDKFLAMLAEEPIDLSDMGLTRIDLELEFGDLPELNFDGPSFLAEQNQSAAAVVAQAEALAPGKPAREAGAAEQEPRQGASRGKTEEQRAAELEEIRNRKRDYRAETENSPVNDASYYLLLTFENAQEKDQFLKSRNFPPDTEYLAAAELNLAPAPLRTAAAAPREESSTLYCLLLRGLLETDVEQFADHV